MNLRTAISRTLVAAATLQLTLGTTIVAAIEPDHSNDTTTPIKHLIVIIGENRSFDHVFATYQPQSPHTVWNLLSEGIVNKDGSPGPNFYKAAQHAAADPTADAFLLSPAKSPFPNNVLPAPLTGGPKDSYFAGDSITLAQQSENGLPGDYYQYLVTGGTGQDSHVPDARIKNVNKLPAGPFQLTGSTLGYHDYAASPVHRFYQMWQQLDCSLENATPQKPSGCDASLFSWVEVTVGAGANGDAQPANFSTEYSATAKTTGEGSTALGFYNIQQGDAPLFKSWADSYAMSDNFHQSVNGGTGANHIMFGHGDAIWYSDGKGHALTPPHNQGVDEIENPNPAAGTNNWYTQDGYSGGSYSNCADHTQPGVSAVAKYLASLPRPIDPRCEAGHYYLLNNYNPGYYADGTDASKDKSPNATEFVIPPSSTPSIGDSLRNKNVSWAYYGDQWNNYKDDPYQLNYGAIGAKTDDYCTICNPFQYDTSIMTNDYARNKHMRDTTELYAAIAKGNLPAVAIVKPSGLVDGHPASSKLDLFEGFSKKIVDAVKANPSLWKDTAILITFDEGGGYYDSGYVQPVDFFGDGPRIPLMVVSRFTQPGHISHQYSDHVSILKFIERNWQMKPVTSRSRDNFPNPIHAGNSQYVPVNTPAISDLFDLFDFSVQ